MKIKLFRNKVVMFFLFFLMACDGDGALNIADGGIGGTGIISEGPITNFGSIFVNGVEYEIAADTVIIRNDQEITEDDLELGMVVRIEGTIENSDNSGKANRVEFNDNVIGPVQEKNQDNNSLTVLGQQVIVDQLTIFAEGTDFDTLEINDVVEVSGLVDAQGNILATRIALQSELTSFKVRGRPSQLDPITQTLTIGELEIDYSRLPINENEIQLLDIQGTLNNDQFIADRIIDSPQKVVEKNTNIKFHGVITRFNSASDFDLLNSPAMITSGTIFKFGSAADLALNVKLDVKGYLNDEGILVLEEVVFLPPRPMSIEAQVQAVDTVHNNITLLGVSIQINNTTSFRDHLHRLRTFNLKDLSIGESVEVHVFLDSTTNTLIAEQLQREYSDIMEGVRIEGTINSFEIATRTLNVLGITVMVDENTRYFDKQIPKFPMRSEDVIAMAHNPNPQPGPNTNLTADEFFSRVQEPGSFVNVEGRLVGDIVVADVLIIDPEPKR